MSRKREGQMIGWSIAGFMDDATTGASTCFSPQLLEVPLAIAENVITLDN